MSTDLEDVVRRLVEDGVAPSAVLAVSASGRKVVVWAGQASERTVFDLASVTKPVTALTVARLVRAARLDWGDRLGDLLAEARGTPSAQVTVELLLAHRAGLEGHLPLYAEKLDRFHALERAARARVADTVGEPPLAGFAPVYSDLGYLLLGEAVARRIGTDLDDIVRTEVARPLGLELGSARQWRASDPAFDRRVAPTEDMPYRGGIVRGAVHDENAWALGGEGLCGHAGLFGTADDVLSLGKAVLAVLSGGRDDFLTRDQIVPLVRPRPGGTLRAGFDGKSEQGSSAGTKFGPRSIGHLGFTGTSLWIDPDRDLAAVLLTNRVHPSRAADGIRAARPWVHDAVFEWAARVAV
jgi:CubicO group peptidase (beta-lactamase class C family)